MNIKKIAVISAIAASAVGVWAVSNYPDCTLSLGVVTDTATCKMQSTKLSLKIYQVGLCTALPSGPTTTQPPDFSSCTTIFSNSSGASATINGVTGGTLNGTATRPVNGSYSYAYVVISSNQTLQQSVEFNSARTVVSGASSGPICWTKSGTLYNYDGYNPAFVECGNSVGSNLGEVVKEMNSMDQGTFSNSSTGTLPGGIAFNGYLTGDDLLLKSAPSSAKSMGLISRQIYIAGPASTPLVINDSTSGIDIGFSTSRGAKVKFDSGTGELQNILSGELLYTFTTRN